MSEDEIKFMDEKKDLIFLGAAILLAPLVAQRKRIEPEDDTEIRMAVAYAYLLTKEVADLKKRIKIGAPELQLGFIEYLKELAKKP